MTNEIETVLTHCTYFETLSAASRGALAKACRVSSVRKREQLFHEGELGHSIFLLLSGAIQLLKTSLGGREVVVRTVLPGEVFAEVVLFERELYPVTAVALSASRLCVIPRHDFLRLLDMPAFRNDFIKGLLGRMRYLAERILMLTAHDVEDRFFAFLEEQYGRKDAYPITISKKDLAAAIGATPETLSRLKERLESQKILQWKGRTVRLKSGFWTSR